MLDRMGWEGVDVGEEPEDDPWALPDFFAFLALFATIAATTVIVLIAILR